jgi:hypothetical protein
VVVPLYVYVCINVMYNLRINRVLEGMAAVAAVAAPRSLADSNPFRI